jgi:hypothetical protein
MSDNSENEYPEISDEELEELAEINQNIRNEERYTCFHTIPDDDEYVKCLCCEKDILIDQNGFLNDAGYAYISFDYGSRHDQGKGFGGYRLESETPDRKEKLLACDDIVAFICDDCFDKKQLLLKGYIKTCKTTCSRKV